MNFYGLDYIDLCFSRVAFRQATFLLVRIWRNAILLFVIFNLFNLFNNQYYFNIIYFTFIIYIFPLRK